MVQSSSTKEKIKFSTLETTRFVQKQDVLAKIANDEALYQKFKIWNNLSVEERKQRKLIPNLFNFLSINQKDNQNDLEIIELMQHRNHLKQENKDFGNKYLFEQKSLDRYFRENRVVLQRLINPEASLAEQKRMKDFSAEELLEIFKNDFYLSDIKISLLEQAALFHLIGKDTENDLVSFVKMNNDLSYEGISYRTTKMHQEIKSLFIKFKKPFTKDLTEDLNNLTDGYKFKMNLFSNLEKEKQNSLEQKQTILEITKHIDTLLIRSVKEEDPSAFLIDITPEKPIFLLNAMSFEKTEEVIPEKEIDNVVAMSKPKSGKLKKIANKIKIAASLLFVSALSLVTGSKTQAPNKQAHEIFARPVMNKTVIITPQQNKPTIKAEKLEAKSFSAPLEKKTAQAVTVKHRHDEKVHPATDRDARNTDSLKVVSLHVEDVQKQEMVFKSILENKKIVLQNDTLSKTISIDSAQRVSKLSFTF